MVGVGVLAEQHCYDAPSNHKLSISALSSTTCIARQSYIAADRTLQLCSNQNVTENNAARSKFLELKIMK